jgi:uncharacterized delta-60 repeat protein
MRQFAIAICLTIALLQLTLIPGSASVTGEEVTGTVLTLDGRGVFGARVVLSLPGGEERFTQSNPAGFFRFKDVPTGQPVTLTVTHKLLQFDPQTLTITGATTLLFAVKARQTNSTVDSTFGSNGRVTTDFGGNDRALSVFAQADGRIVAIGTTGIQAAIARYNSDGTLDLSFGTGGKVISPNLILTTDLNIKPGALQPDNKIVVVGRDANLDFLVERRLDNGALDTAFGTGGLVSLNIGGTSADQAKAVAVQADGKIVVAGTTNFGTVNAGLAVARFNADGSLDTTFGSGGRTIMDTAGVDEARAIAFQPDGKILVAGIQGSTRPLVVRLNADGTPDSGFGAGGIATLTHTGGGYDLSLQRNGKVVVIGEGLARLNADGLPDTVFNGPTGAIGVPSTELQTVALRADGMILAGGRAFVGASDGDFGLALVHPLTAQIISHFEADLLNHRFDDPKDMLVQPDGKILIAGYTVPTATADFALVRFVNF